MVPYRNLEICSVSILSTVVDDIRNTNSIFGIFVSRNVEGVSSGEFDSLVFRCMVDGVFSDKLDGSIIRILLEYSNCSFGKGNSEIVDFGISDFYIVAGFFISLTVTTCTEYDLMEFSDFDSICFWDKLYLFLRVFINSYWNAKSIHMKI